MRVDDELLGGPFVEVLVALRRLVEPNHGGVDRSGNLYLVMQDGHHQLAMIAHYRALAGHEGEGLGPAQANTHPKLPDLGIFINAAGVAGHIETGNADLTTC